MSDDAEQASLDEVVEEYAKGDEKSGSRDEWVEKKIGEIFNQIYSGGTPKRGKDKYYEGGSIPFVKIEDLNRQKLEGVTDADEAVTETAIEEGKTRKYEPGTLLVTIYGSIAETAVVDEPVATNQGIIGLWGNEDDNTLYAKYRIDYDKEYLDSLSRQTTQANIGKGILKKHKLPLLPLPEQRKIASVLYNVDEAIRKTEEIIEQLNLVRRGTEQDLLTRGVLEDGTPRTDSDIEYKSSWVGEVPKDWRVLEYEELITDSSVGIVVKPSQYYDESGEVPIIRSKDISRDGIVNGDFEYMTQESNEENANSQLQEGDVITVRSGEPGLSCVVSSEYSGANCADLLISTPGERLNPHYASLWINSYAGRKQIDRFQAGLAQKHFNLGALRKLNVAVPSIEEQQRIVDKMSSITGLIQEEEKYADRLHRLKRALMQDLLTGEVRTKNRDIDVLPEVEAHG